jgi:hypothetical protein
MEIDMLKLGTETGSLINHVLSSTHGPAPMVGEAATVLHWSDRNPATVVAYDAAKQIVTLREDKATCTNFEMQDYTYEASETGATYEFKREKNGSWVQVFFNRTTGRWIKSKGAGLIIGRREKYRDPSF